MKMNFTTISIPVRVPVLPDYLWDLVFTGKITGLTMDIHPMGIWAGLISLVSSARSDNSSFKFFLHFSFNCILNTEHDLFMARPAPAGCNQKNVHEFSATGGSAEADTNYHELKKYIIKNSLDLRNRKSYIYS